MHAPAILAVLSATFALSAQGGPPTLVTRPAMMRIAAEQVPELLAQLPKTALGRLLEEPEVATAFKTALQHHLELATRREQLWQAASTLGVELEPWLMMNRTTGSNTEALRSLELSEMLRLEMAAGMPSEAQRTPSTAVMVSCTPRAEGRWTALFEQRAKRVAEDKNWSADPDAKFEGYSTYAFVPANLAEDDPNYEWVRGTRTWMLHLPGTFAWGSGRPEHCGTVAPAPARSPAGLSLTMDLAAYLKMFTIVGVGVPAEFAALGFDSLQQVQWRLRFEGERVLDEFEVQVAAEPRGLVGALLSGTAKLPAQPLPDGALAQLRAAIDVKLLLEAAQTMSGGLDLPDGFEKDLLQAFTGGLALGVTAPLRGQVFPRLFLSLGIADEQALDRVLNLLVAQAKTKPVTYEDVPCTVLTLPGMPAVVQPTFCRLDGVLHIAESGASMRAFLKARKDGVEGMDVGDVPVPAGAGELMPLELRCDEAAMYRTFYEVWLPLYALAESATGQSGLLQRDDMPPPEAVEKHVGKSRGELRREGKTYTLRHLGSLGGPETAALLMTWGPIVSTFATHDYTDDQVETAVARHQLTKVWDALEKWRTQNGHLPDSLGELVAAGKLSADTLLVVPGDPGAETIELPGADKRSMQSSFRYFPKTVKVDTGVGQSNLLLIAIAPRQYNRAVLADDGSTPDVWGDASRWPIDKFGK